MSRVFLSLTIINMHRNPAIVVDEDYAKQDLELLAVGAKRGSLQAANHVV